MSERYEEQAGGVLDTQTGRTLRRGDEGWDEYERSLASRLTVAPPDGRGPPLPRPIERKLPALALRRKEARARFRGRLSQALWPRRASVLLASGARVPADPMHLLYYLLLTARGNLNINPANVIAVDGTTIVINAAVAQEIVRLCANRIDRFMQLTAAKLAEVEAAADPDAVTEPDWQDEDADPSPPVGGPIPLPPAPP